MIVAVSLFERAADNSPDEHQLSAEEFLNSFMDEPELVEGALSLDEVQLRAVKSLGRAWGGRFSGPRSQKNFLDVPAVVFDLDGPNKAGVELESILHTLDSMNVAFAVHSTFSSGFVAPLHKLRVVISTSRPVNAEEYLALWGKYAERLGADPAAKNAERLHFIPRVPAEHKGHYFAKVVTDRPSLVPGASGRRSLNDTDSRGPARDWLHELRTCENKNETLIGASFRLGKLSALNGRTEDQAFAEVWLQCHQALRDNTVSAPVADWNAAQATCRRGVSNGFKAALEEAETLSNPAGQVKTDANAGARLQKFVRQVKKHPYKSVLDRAAREIGVLVAAGLLEEDEAVSALSTAAAEGALDAAEISSVVATGLGVGKEEYTNEKSWMRGISYTKDGTPASSDENVIHVLRHHPACKGLLYTDTRADAKMLSRLPPWETDCTEFPAPLKLDACVSKIMSWLFQTIGCSASIGLQRATSCVLTVADEHCVDPFREYLEGLKWDGVPRLSGWLPTYVGCEDSAYSRAVGRRWLIGAVARTFEPGCRMDNVLVLTGKQGIGKSSTFLYLVPERGYFQDSLPSMDDKDTAIYLHMAVIVEMAELAHMLKRDVEKIKHFISGRAGQVRRAYARDIQDFPRRSVLAGTTNVLYDALEDQTGARRFWIVEAKACNTAGLIAVRNQLWAEAAAAYRDGEQWHLTPAEEVESLEAQELATRQDPHVEKLQGLIEGALTPDLERFNPQDPSGYISVEEGQKDTQGRLRYIRVEQVCTLMEYDFKRDCRRAAEVIRLVGWEKKAIQGRRAYWRR